MGFKVTEFTVLVMDAPEQARRAITRRMKLAHGNVREVARGMGVSRETLYSYLRRLGLTADQFREESRR